MEVGSGSSSGSSSGSNSSNCDGSFFQDFQSLLNQHQQQLNQMSKKTHQEEEDEFDRLTLEAVSLSSLKLTQVLATKIRRFDWRAHFRESKTEKNFTHVLKH